MRGVMRALLRQLASRVAVQPGDSPPVRKHLPAWGKHLPAWGTNITPDRGLSFRCPVAPTVSKRASKTTCAFALHLSCPLPPSPQVSSEVVPLVASLVELERTVYHSREVLEAAETALAAQPDVLINRICLHFQRLFGCRSLEGVLPAMNKLWVTHSGAWCTYWLGGRGAWQAALARHSLGGASTEAGTGEQGISALLVHAIVCAAQSKQGMHSHMPLVTRT